MVQIRTSTLLLIMSTVLAACGSAPPTATTTSIPAATAVASAAPLTAPPAGTPVGVIAIGHSAMTGEWSDPNNPGMEVRENSWATGTAPEVNSIYQRLVAARPETAGHVANEASAGASAILLTSQAQAALQKVPTPALVLIQSIDNDIQCDGSDPANVKVFGAAVADALRVIVEASPNSHILMLSQPGRPSIDEAKAISPADRPSPRNLDPAISSTPTEASTKNTSRRW